MPLLKIKKKPPPLSLKDFYNKRNKVLLIRDARGIGDILNCRMLFKAFKEAMPDCHLTFACWKEYHNLVKDHPYLDAVIESRDIKKENFIISYDITTACIYYESLKNINGDKHRADIWADHCGLTLTDHDMLLPFIDPEDMAFGHLQVKQLRNISMRKFNKDSPSVLFAPISFEKMRSLPDRLIELTVKMLRERDLFVYSTHNTSLPIMEKLSVPVLQGANYTEWMSFVHPADYVVTVDTSTFHYAGGIGKPMTGIFTHVDGKLRGKYYDFILVQKHKDNGDWPCGPCYNYLNCTNPRCKAGEELRPCVTELTFSEIEEGVAKMLTRWPK